MEIDGFCRNYIKIHPNSLYMLYLLCMLFIEKKLWQRLENICMKRILLLSGGWRRFILSAWYMGINQYIKEHGGDYSLDEYTCWGNWNQNEHYNRGEYAVFTLPDFDRYDGIIVDPSNIGDPMVREDVIEAVVKSGRPAISLCLPEKGLHCISTDNYLAECQIFEHLYEKHRCRSFHFAGGRREDAESWDRERAFIDCCKKHGIEVTPDMLTERDYSPSTGVLTAKKFLDAEGSLTRPLPDAFVCANDNIAVSLIVEMKKYGFFCPRDFRVTGFDNLDKALYLQPQVTTVTLAREKVAYQAMTCLDKMMNGEEVPDHVRLIPEIIYSESCGCPNSGRVDYRGYLSWQVEDNIFISDMDEELSRFTERLDPQLPVGELTERVLKKYSEYDLDGVYIVLDDRLESGELPKAFYESEHLYVAAACEREKISAGRAVGEAAAGNRMKKLSPCPAEALRSHIRAMPRGSATLTFPMHIKERSAGYITLLNPRFIKDNWRFFETQDVVLHALWDWDSNRRLNESYKKLRKIYDKDILTGMYSKSAFNTRFVPWFTGRLSEGHRVAVLFIDVDSFKQINDTMGHDYGDYVLQQIAGAIEEFVPDEGFTFRYGGDEFVAAFTVGSPEEGDRTRRRMLDRILQMKFSVSIGLSVTPKSLWDDGEIRAHIDDCIREADHDMYEWKKLHHRRQNKDT